MAVISRVAKAPPPSVLLLLVGKTVDAAHSNKGRQHMIKAIPLIQSIARFELATKTSFGKLNLFTETRVKGNLRLLKYSDPFPVTAKSWTQGGASIETSSEVVLEVEDEVAPGASNKHRTVKYNRRLKDDLLEGF